MYFQSQSPTLRRRGFTLVEMLVVIAIIAILAAAAAWAVVAMIGGQQRRNTEATILTVNKIFQTHWNAVIAEATKKDDLANFPAIVSLAGGDPERAKVLLVKFRLMEAFPQTYAEIGNGANPPWVYNYIPPGQQRYNAYYQTQLGGSLAAKNPLTESGACLRIALSVTRDGAAALADDKLKFAIADTDGDGITELIDSFENPKQALAFFRFAYNTGGATDNAAFQASNPAVGKNARVAKFPDPTDPNGTLVNPAWYATPNRLTFEMYFHPVTSPYPLAANAKPPFTGCYVAPVIVSAGAKLDPTTNTRPFGFTLANGYFSSAHPSTAMQPDMSIANQAQANDNIYNFQLTAGN